MTFSYPAIGQGGLHYEGSSTIGEFLLPELAKAFTAKTGISFDAIGLAGSGKGFAAIMEGKADMAGMSRSLTIEEKKQKPYYMIIAYDAIGVFVHDANPVKNLSKEQLKNIFTGVYKNWTEAGGGETPIEVITEIKTSGRATIKEFQETAMDNAAFGPSKEIEKPIDCVRYVGANQNAVTHGSMSFVKSDVRALQLDGIAPDKSSIQSGAYLLSRPLLIITKELPRKEVKQFMEFIISKEGQEIVSRYFVPVQ